MKHVGYQILGLRDRACKAINNPTEDKACPVKKTKLTDYDTCCKGSSFLQVMQQKRANAIQDDKISANSPALASLSTLASQLASYYMAGKMSTKFCLGKHEFCERDANRAIFGSIELTGTTGCVSVPVKIPKLTFGAVLYVVTGGSESVLKSIGPAAGVGIKDATLLLEASGASFVRITASGSPFIWGVKGPVGSFIQHAGSNVVLEMSAAYYFAGKTVTRFSIGAKPIKISNTLRMSNVAGTMGPSAFSEVLTATVPAASQVAKVGIEIPMIVCVEDCKMSKPKELFFSGKLYFLRRSKRD